MVDEYDENSKYNDILNRMQSNYSFDEGFFLTIKEYFTNNMFYYVLCVIFRFNPLLLISISYTDLDDKYYNSKLLKKILGTLTLYNIIEYIQLTYKMYIIITILIYISFFIRMIIYFKLVGKIRNYKYTHKWPLPSKYRIISDHVLFLFFPYIIEYLSFAYYIYLFPSKYIIKFNNGSKPLLIFILIINSILIIYYNIINHMYLFSVNRIYTTTIYDVISKINNKNKYKCQGIVAFRCSNFVYSFLIFIQNITSVLKIEKYVNKYKFRIIFKAVIIIIILLIIMILFFSRIHKYNYTNFINIYINVIILFCFYSITFDFILIIIQFTIRNDLYEVLFILIKIILSYVSYTLYIFGNKQFFELKIVDILFQQKNSVKETVIINSVYYLNEIMIKAKENKDISIIKKILDHLYRHINNCNKQECNCHILKFLIKEKNTEELKKYISELLIVLNYLYELAFIQYDYSNKYELAILLSEHFCHLKDNPTMAFSIINTFFQNQKKNLSKNQSIILYELSQKYIYYISAEVKKNIDIEIFSNKKELLIKNERMKNYRNYFNNLITTNKVKKYIHNYIDILIKILKYKNIFEDSLSIQNDENNEDIISIKINFFNETSYIENDNNNNIINKEKENKLNLVDNHNDNLYNIIDLLKSENVYYKNLKYSINHFEIMKDIPVFIIFKFFLFYDILQGGKIPDNEANKLKSLIDHKISLINNYISKKEYTTLKEIYYIQNNKKDSKHFIVFEFKKDLNIKYFSESCSLKLGYKQKDIIKETIGCLMPKQFYEPHQKLIKQELIGNQLKYIFYEKHFLFDESSSIMYPIKFEALLIYNLTKNLIIISQSIFIVENEYTFMLNNNFELMSSSKNFEDDYYLNQKIFNIHNIKLTNILKIKPEKLTKKFDKTLKKINFQKSIRKIKTEEYMIHKIYSSSERAGSDELILNYYNNSKNNILLKMLNSYNEEEVSYEGTYERDNNDNDEKVKLINKEKMEKIFNETLINPVQTIFHDTCTITLNKKKFIRNFAKALSVISTNENDNYYNSIIKAKNLIEKLTMMNDLYNNYIKVNINLSYYYNRLFYFVKIDDINKVKFKISKHLNLESNIKNIDHNKSHLISQVSLDYKENLKSTIKSRNRSYFKNRNDSIIIKNKTNKNVDNKNIKTKSSINKRGSINDINNKGEENDFINRINIYREKINKDKFISIISLILLIIIICIVIIYIIIIKVKENTTNKTEKIIMANYYNFKTRDILLDIYSKLLQIYYELNNISQNSLNDIKEQQNTLLSFTNTLKEIYHNFTEYSSQYNIEFDNNFNSIYNNLKIYKIIGFWEEIEYESRYIEEINIIIYNIYSIDLIKNNNGLLEDCKNFLFFNNTKKYNCNQKVQTEYAKILFYFCANYEVAFKNIFNDTHLEIEKSFNRYMNSNIIIYYLLEIIVFLFYIIFFILVIIYLYYSNQVIIKNIIFLFLDFTKEEYNKNLKNSNDNLIILKLIEFKNIIDDFDLNKLKIYGDNIDNINKNKNLKINDTLSNHENEMEIKTDPYNQTKFINSSQHPINENQKKILKKENSINNNDYSLFNQNNNNKLYAPLNKNLSNSSLNNLMNLSNSHIFKDKLNNNLINNSNKSLTTNNNNDNNNNNNENIKDILNTSKTDNSNNIQNIILNQSYLVGTLIIKIFLLIILLLFLIILICSLIKIIYLLTFIQELKNYFNDFRIISDRFSFLIYYFNIFRTLIIFHDERHTYSMKIMLDNIDTIVEEESNEYKNFLIFNSNKYNKTKRVLKNLTNTDSESTNIINETICSKEKECIKYLNSKFNIYDSGFDFSYKSSFSHVSNFYKDYLGLNNKTNIEEIKSIIINGNHTIFNSISMSISNLIFYVKSKVYQCFQDDQTNFLNRYNKILTVFNIISIIFSIFVILFINIFIFISLSRFIVPIKGSTYRINKTFYFIKKYSF